MDDQINFFMLSFVENNYNEDDYNEILTFFTNTFYSHDKEKIIQPKTKEILFHTKLKQMYNNLDRAKIKFFFLKTHLKSMI